MIWFIVPSCLLVLIMVGLYAALRVVFTDLKYDP